MRNIMRFRFVCALLLGLIMAAAAVDRGVAQTRGTSQLSEALDAWRAGDLVTARSLLSEIVAAGTRDARVLYYRGILLEQSGADGRQDFEQAAVLEVGAGTSRRVNQALERIQGPLRTKIEGIREAARAAGASDPVAAAHALRYRDALSAIRSGDLAAAAAALDQIIAAGTRSPRAWYMRGVVALRSGDSAGAASFFEQGLSREHTRRDMELVSEALSELPGDVRRQIEEQVTVTEGDQQVTRRERFRTVLAREQAMTEDAVAARNAEKERQGQEEAAARRAREEEAVAEFRAEQQQRAEAESRLRPAPADSAAAGSAAAPVPANGPVPPAPRIASQEPTTSPSVDPSGRSLLSAEAPDNEPEAGGPVNPFSRKSPSSPLSPATASTRAVDFSWLAPNSELIVFSRPASLLGTPFMAPVRELPWFDGAMAQLSGQTGISPLDIESITFGMGDVMMQFAAGALQAGGADGRPDPGRIAAQFANNQSAISVVRTTQEMDLAAVIRTVGGQEQSYGSRTWYLIPSQAPGAPDTAVCAIDGRTVLAGTEASLKAALDRGPGSPTNPQFRFLSSDRQFVLAFSSPALAPMSGSLPIPPEAPILVQDLMNAIRGQVGGVAIVLNAEKDLQLSLQLSLNDASAGESAVKVVEQAIQMAQQMYPSIQDQVPPPLQDVARSAVSSLRSGFDDSVLSATVRFPSELIAAVQNMAPLFGPMMGGGIQPPGEIQNFPPAEFGNDPNFPNPSDSGFGFEPAEPGDELPGADSPAATDGAFGFEAIDGTTDPSPSDSPEALDPNSPPATFPSLEDIPEAESPQP